MKNEIDNENWKGGAAPLHLAASIGRTEVMEMMIEAGANVNA